MPICPNCGYDYRTADRASAALPATAPSGASSSGLLRALAFVGLAVIFLAVVYVGWARPSGATTVPAGDLPPAGSIWFGTSFDTTTFAIAGHTSMFTPGDPLVLVAHFSRTIPGGQAINLLYDGQTLKSVAASTSDYDACGQTLSSALLPTGGHTFTIQDLGGNQLANGSLTVLP